MSRFKSLDDLPQKYREQAQAQLSKKLPGPLPGSPLLEPDTFKNEREFQRRVEQEATARGWRIYHTYDSRKSHKGFLDLFGIRGTRIIFWEFKMPGNKATPHQRAWLAEAEATGKVDTGVFYPEDMPQILELLDQP